MTSNWITTCLSTDTFMMKSLYYYTTDSTSSHRRRNVSTIYPCFLIPFHAGFLYITSLPTCRLLCQWIHG
ncbi:hypothetical protein GDO78_018517 [Eleutherodactylus coqui]|uniref:Uncharacterized protein n=1 Tax=Eleutherodactylus coqui TaxID=57060 RepID=A0A8J6B8V2_ELECQ|nr:hypothetical protein GDO78_018517 [Eleutherodactylus coqui]